jgi:hypothetical protein
MGFSIDSIQKGVKKIPRKVIIYGSPKMGKSTLASSAPNSLMIPTEDRVAHIDCDKAPVVTTYEEILEIFNFLLKEKHSYKNIIIDSLDWLEPILHTYICKKKSFTSLTDDHNKETAFQKGLKYHAVEGWKNLFLDNCDVLRDAGMNVIAVAHSQTITVNPPNTDSYDKAVMKIDKNALAVIEEWADVIAFYDKDVFVRTDEKSLKKQGKVLSQKKRTLYLSGENPAMINGNSFGLGDAEVQLEYCSDIMEWLLTETKNEIKKNKEGNK